MQNTPLRLLQATLLSGLTLGLTGQAPSAPTTAPAVSVTPAPKPQIKRFGGVILVNQETNFDAAKARVLFTTKPLCIRGYAGTKGEVLVLVECPK